MDSCKVSIVVYEQPQGSSVQVHYAAHVVVDGRVIGALGAPRGIHVYAPLDAPAGPQARDSIGSFGA